MIFRAGIKKALINMSHSNVKSSLLEEIENSAPTEKVRIWGLGGAGFVIRSGNDIIYIDPWLVPPDPSRTTHRAGGIPFPAEKVRRANAVLSTHDHEDHCNIATILAINKSTSAKFIGPISSTTKVLRGGLLSSESTAISPGDEVAIGQSMSVRAFVAKDPYEPQAVMLLIESPRGNILHSGDTSYFEGFQKVGSEFSVEVALLNFGKQIPTPEKPYYMNAEKLAIAARDLRAKIVVPMHWNLWVETREEPSVILPVLERQSPLSRLEIVDVAQRLDL
jgi:L-ascorbate 6-phosphate lactonase